MRTLGVGLDDIKEGKRRKRVERMFASVERSMDMRGDGGEERNPRSAPPKASPSPEAVFTPPTVTFADPPPQPTTSPFPHPNDEGEGEG
jgi:hypothetical protein